MQRMAISSPLLLFVLAGCEKAATEIPKIETPPVVQQIQQQVNNTVETVKQTAQVAGKLELNVGGPLQTGGSYARLITMGGRDSILQITSYNDVSNEQFPSVFVRGRVGATTAAHLLNKQMYAEVFVQRVANGPVLSTAPGRPAQLKISRVEGNVVTGEFLPGSTLIDSQTRTEVPVSGTFISTLQQ